MQIIIFNTVLSDGVGDYYHMEKIVRHLQQHVEYRDVDMTAIILFDEKGPVAVTARNHKPLGPQTEL